MIMLTLSETSLNSLVFMRDFTCLERCLEQSLPQGSGFTQSIAGRNSVLIPYAYIPTTADPQYVRPLVLLFVLYHSSRD